MNEIEIKLFGAFRKYVPSGRIKIQVLNQFTVLQLKEKINSVLQEQVPGFNEPSLVYESALATETEVLNEDALISNQRNLALLPPVCGG